MTRMTRAKLWLAVSAACAALAGCSSSTPTQTATPDASTSGDGDDAGEATCDNAQGLDTYVANLTKAGKSGLSFVLKTSDPAPPARGTNNWTLAITDTTGAGVAGATIDVKPFMPLHGHGSSIVPTITDSGGGAYVLSNLYLFMPGLWTITINAKAGAISDAAVFTFCIAG
jgi:hypothetical protein